MHTSDRLRWRFYALCAMSFRLCCGLETPQIAEIAAQVFGVQHSGCRVLTRRRFRSACPCRIAMRELSEPLVLGPDVPGFRDSKCSSCELLLPLPYAISAVTCFHLYRYHSTVARCWCTEIERTSLLPQRSLTLSAKHRLSYRLLTHVSGAHAED